MKKVFYWSPYLTNVATIHAVINSMKSLKKFSSEYEPTIINCCGEFNAYKDDLRKSEIKIINLFPFDYHKLLPSKGFFFSRFSYLLIFILSFFPLLFLIKSKKPDFLILHLITSLPLLIANLINTKTKFILRISGLPKYNLIRKIYWSHLGKKIYKVTCPTEGTLKDLKYLKLFESNKIYILKDPIIKINDLIKSKNHEDKQIFNEDDFNIICVGRLTRQKNFKLIINSFDKFLEIKKNSKLFIIGDGEEKNDLIKLIKLKKLDDKIKILGFKNNIFYYFSKANLFVLCSLWEDPGWVLIEAAANNTLILASNCKNGPSEFLENDKGGILFQNESAQSLIDNYKKIVELSKSEVIRKKIFSKKKSKQYTLFQHNLVLVKIFQLKKLQTEYLEK
jgi:glycosyltransferase involved in cell wall biosynthesis